MDISWEEYNESIESLAKQIHESKYKFDRIVCLSRGGLRVGDILSRIFDRPLAILAAKSYQGENQQEQSELEISSQLTFTGKLGVQILLVDDLVDSGETLRQTRKWLIHKYSNIEQIKTAVIWYKPCSTYLPDYCSLTVFSDIWIHQPFEKYDKFSFSSPSATADTSQHYPRSSAATHPR